MSVSQRFMDYDDRPRDAFGLPMLPKHKGLKAYVELQETPQALFLHYLSFLEKERMSFGQALFELNKGYFVKAGYGSIGGYHYAPPIKMIINGKFFASPQEALDFFNNERHDDEQV